MVGGVRVPGGDRFFSDLKLEFETFIETSKDLQPGYFTEKFSEVEDLEDEATRGRYFDYFVGLLFNQLPDVEVIIGKEVATGEVDVFVICLYAPDWLHRLVGEATLLENKWRVNPIGTNDISVFHDKARMATASCKLCYFISMSGFTSERRIGSEQLIQSKDNPKMVGWTREEVERMVSQGSPVQLLKESMM